MNAQSWTRYKGTRERLNTVFFPMTIGGFFFGVLAYLGLGFGLGFSGLAALAVGVLSGAAFGLVLAATSWVVHRFGRGQATLLVAGGVVLGACAGASISFIVTANPPQGAWKRLPPPPEPAATLVDAARLGVYGQEVYVAAASGQIYGYACLNWLVCSWRPVPELPLDVQPSGEQPGCSAASGSADTAAPQFVATRDFSFCLPETKVYFETGLQADGNLYLWVYAYSTLDSRQIVLLYAVIGALLGAGSLYLLVRNRRLPVDEDDMVEISGQN